MTVYAATETEMGATTAKFSRLNGYYVVAETAQKAVDAVRAARPFFAGVHCPPEPDAVSWHLLH